MYSLATLTGILTLAASAQASALATPPANDAANDWDKSSCAELAVIFARGTFDSGNIGPWVGGPFRDALYSKIGASKIAFQGVDPRDYPASLDGYIDEGGSQSCAVSLGKAVEKYSARCPSAKIVISGWSQGALCAHKSLDASTALANPHARSQVIAVAIFGDPISVWSDSIKFPALPGNAKLVSYCQVKTPDPLCTNPLADFPTSPKAFIDKLEAMWRSFNSAQLNDAQKSALSDLPARLIGQAKSKIGKLGKDIAAGHIRRWMLTPPHFFYGLGPHPMTEQAAQDIANLFHKSK